MSDDADAGGAEAKGEAKEEGPTAVSCAAAAGVKTEGVDAGAGPSVGAGSANGLAAMTEEVSSDGEPAEPLPELSLPPAQRNKFHQLQCYQIHEILSVSYQ